MSRFERSDILFSFALCSVLVGIFSLWFFLNSNSPWFSKSSYFFIFSDVGTLKAGDPVTINGMQKGKVGEVSLEGELAVVEALILENVQIPEDSRARIINTGLMGERTLALFLGSQKKLLNSGERRAGLYDAGSAKLIAQAGALFMDLDTLFGKLGHVLDTTLLDPDVHRQLRRMRSTLHKVGKNLGRSIDRNLPLAIQTIENIDSLRKMSADLLDVLEPLGKRLTYEGSAGIENSRRIITAFRQTGARVVALLRKTENGENSVGKILRDTILESRLLRMKEYSDTLLKNLPEKGLDLNVDIF